MRKNNVNIYMLLLVLLAAGGMVSCKKDNNGAPPSIEGVRSTNPLKPDSLFVKALPGTWIVILGDNFQDLKNVYFNDFEASFNAALPSPTSIVINIPPGAPTSATHPDVSNKLKVVTAHGTAEYDFELIAPPPAIVWADNENTAPGNEITFHGQYFYQIEKVIFPGNMEVTNVTTSDSGRVLKVTVPAGLTAGGPVQFVNKYGKDTSIFSVNDLTTGMYNNFDDINPFQWWSASAENNPSSYPGNRGTYAKMAFTTGPNTSDWWSGGKSINNNSGVLLPPAQLSNALGDYAVKFEVFVKKPWKAGTIMLILEDAWKFTARYEPWKVGTASVEFSTPGWRTVSIPLTNFKTKLNNVDGSGDPASSLTELLTASGNRYLSFRFVNSTAENVDFEAGIDNIRIVRIR